MISLTIVNQYNFSSGFSINLVGTMLAECTNKNVRDRIMVAYVTFFPMGQIIVVLFAWAILPRELDVVLWKGYFGKFINLLSYLFILFWSEVIQNWTLSNLFISKTRHRHRLIRHSIVHIILISRIKYQTWSK